MKAIIKFLSNILEPLAKMIKNIGLLFFPKVWVMAFYYILIGLDKIFDKLNANIENKARKTLRINAINVVKHINKDMRNNYDERLKIKIKSNLRKHLNKSTRELEELIGD